MKPPPFTRLVDRLPPTVPFVGPEALERMTGKRFKLRLGANESRFGMSPDARSAIEAGALEASLYGDPENHDLRKAIARRLGVGSDNVLVAGGIDELLGLTVRVFLEPGNTAVTSYGAYQTFNYHVHGFGGHLVQVPYRERRNDLEALTAAAARGRAKLLFLANPDNPTGSYYSGDELRHLLELMPDDCLLVLDEAYFEFGPGDSLPVDVSDLRLIRLRTFSKAHGLAGLRIGYGVAAAQVVAAYDKIRLHFGVNRVAQSAALAALGDQAFLEHVVRCVAAGRHDYERLAQEIGADVLPSAANFVAFDFGNEQRAEFVKENLLERGVFIRKPAFAPLNSCIRITVGTPQDRKELRQIMTEILAAVA